MRRRLFFFLAFLILIAALMRALPALSKTALESVQLPITHAIAAVTTRLPIPFWLILIALAALTLLFRRRGVLLVTAAAYLLVRFPAVCAPRAEIEPASLEAISALSDRLIDALNASDLRFPDSEAALRLSIAAASEYYGEEIGDHAVKFAPEGLMNRLNIAGIYIPFTAEALINPSLSIEALPFTAIHELTHRFGIADEAQANLTAWAISIQSDGALADSARLWALRYAMARVYECDAELWASKLQRMNPAVRASFARIGGNAALNPSERYSLLIDALSLHFSAGCDTIQQREGTK